MRLLDDADALPGEAAVFTTDDQLVVLSWMGWLTEVVPSSRAAGRSLLELVPDLETRGLAERLREVLRDGRPLILAPTFHGHLIPCSPRSATAGVSRMQQHVVASAIRAGEAIVGLTVVLRDVTLRQKHSQRLADALASDDPRERSRAQREVADHPLDPEALAPALSDGRWRVRRRASEALAVGGAEATETLLRMVREAHADAGALNAAIDALALQGEGALPGLAGLLDDRDADVRIYASLALGLVGHPDATPALLQALGDPDVNVRYHAIEALGRIGALGASGALMALAEGDDEFLAFAALEAIAGLGDGSLAPRVAALLGNEGLAGAAVRALGGVGGAEEVPALARMVASNDTSPADVAAALVAIAARVGGERVPRLVREESGPAQLAVLKRTLDKATATEVPALVEVMGWLPGESADLALTAALGRPEAEAAAAQALLARGPDAVPALVRALDAADDVRRTRLASLLGRLGGPEAVDALLGLLSPDDPAAVCAAGALGDIGDPRAFEPLLALLVTEDVPLRRAAVGALNSMGHPELAPRAAELLGHGSAHVREAAARIVGYFGHRAAARDLLGLLSDPDDAVRGAVAEHLAAFDDPETASAFQRALSDPVPAVRAAACRALAHADDTAAVGPLLAALDDPDLWVRYAAARAAGWHDADPLRERLERAAREDAPPVRAAAFEALGALGTPRLPALVRDALGDEEADVAVAAVEALVAGEGTVDASLLAQALAAPDPRVRAAAASGLRRHAATEALESARERALSDPDPGVVRATVRALVASATREGVAAVIPLLGDERRGQLACEALTLVDGEGLSGFDRILDHPDPFVRLAAVQCLGEAKVAAAISTLARALDDEMPAVRVAARRALESRDLRGLERTRMPQAGGGDVR